jgi:hypothetical protein
VESSDKLSEAMLSFGLPKDELVDGTKFLLKRT